MALHIKSKIFLTFDIEDWFHLLDNQSTKYPFQWEQFEKRVDIGLNIILNLCDKYNVQGTFFCLGWIAEKYPDLIREIQRRGHYIGTHGYAHRLVYELSQEEFREDVKKSIKILEEITGTKIEAYRAPGFSIREDSLWAFGVLGELGIKYDSSVFPARRAHGGLPRLIRTKPFIVKYNQYEIIEFPISIIPMGKYSFSYSGGGYFRLIPLLFLKFFFSSSKYVMTYFHPRDFDVNQPILKGLNIQKRFRYYYGINGCLNKLEGLLQTRSCSSIDSYPKDQLDSTEILDLIE